MKIFALSITRFTLPLILLLVTLFFGFDLNAGPIPQKKLSGNRTMSYERAPALDINEIRAWVSNQGVQLQTSSTGPGLEWPINSSKTLVFNMAPWLACQFEGDSSDIRTAAVRDIIDGSEFIPGKILQYTDGLIEPDNPNLSGYRVYRIQQGDDANSNPDYADWPFEDGAPFDALKTSDGLNDSLDAAGNPVPKLDEFGRLIPKLYGDQTTWCVYNDMRQDGRIYSAEPMGCEIRQTAFAFKQSGALGRILFFRFEIHNKQVPDAQNPQKGLWKNCYFGIFSDHDVGELTDDLVGCDTMLGLGYTYNATNSDAVYGAASPAVGVDFFQGPIVEGLSTPDTLKATGFVRFNNTVDAADADPHSGRPKEVYNYFLGLDRLGNFLPGKPNGSKFMYPADPETQSGSEFVEKISEKNDKRSVLYTGPFDLAAGETEVIYCAVLVGQGSSHLNSVTDLKQTDKIAQAVFDAQFQAPSAIAPSLSVTELDKAIMLNWLEPNSKLTAYTPNLESAILERPGAEAENDRYEFQGYVVYQYQDADGEQGSYKPIAVFDVKDSVTGIQGLTQVEINGSQQTVVATVISGEDSGIQRSLVVKEDALNNTSLINGTRYYFGVTAYYTNPYQLAKSPYPDQPDSRTAPAYLESLAIPVVAVPQKPVSEMLLPYESEQDIETDRFANGGDDNVLLNIVNPLNVPSGNYEVRILDEAGSLWQLFDMAQNTVAQNALGEAIDSLSVWPESSVSPVPVAFNGLHITVRQNPLGLRNDAQGAPYPLRYLPIENQFFKPKANLYSGYGESETELTFQASTMGESSASGAVWYPEKNLFTGSLPGSSVSAKDLMPVEIEFTTDPTKQQYAYRYVLNINPNGVDPLQPLSQMIYEPGFASYIDTSGSGLVQQFQKSNQGPFQANVWPHPKVPLRAFEVDPETGQRLRQLQVLFTERNDPANLGGAVDGQWQPNTSLSGGQELLCITATTYDPNNPDTMNVTYTYTDEALGTPRLFARDQDKLDIQYQLWIRQNADQNGNPLSYQEGDRLLITPNYNLSPATTYRFELEGASESAENVKTKLDRIGVFPNPYFGRSSREQLARETVVTFINLPATCTIRIFTLNGELVREIKRVEKQETSLEDWNLKNKSGVPVASGLYLVHVETPVGNKILKFAIVQRERRDQAY